MGYKYKKNRTYINDLPDISEIEYYTGRGIRKNCGLKKPSRENYSKNYSTYGHGYTYGSNKEDLYPICNYFSKDWVCISLEATIPVNNNGWAWAELNYDNIEKLKTIGDSYMCAAGLPSENRGHAIQVCLAALEMMNYLKI